MRTCATISRSLPTTSQPRVAEDAEQVWPEDVVLADMLLVEQEPTVVAEVAKGPRPELGAGTAEGRRSRGTGATGRADEVAVELGTVATVVKSRPKIAEALSRIGRYASTSKIEEVSLGLAVLRGDLRGRRMAMKPALVPCSGDRREFLVIAVTEPALAVARLVVEPQLQVSTANRP